MIDLRTLEEQLKRAKCNFRFWGRAELRELSNILMPGETVAFGVNGHYAGGFAFLCVTDRRLLLIDRKPMYLTLEDVRFDMIAEVDYSYRVLDATIRVFTSNKSLIFTSWSQHRLRELVQYTQQRVMEIRQYYMGQQFQQPISNSDQGQANDPTFVPSFGAQGGLAATGGGGGVTVQQAGKAGITGATLPMHNPYAQIPLTSRHWRRR